MHGNRNWQERVSHLEQHEADLDVLAEIADFVSKQAGPQQLLTSVLAVLERRLGMLRGTVMLLLPDGNELFVEAAHGVPKATVRKHPLSQRRRCRRPGHPDRPAGGHSASFRGAAIPEPHP